MREAARRRARSTSREHDWAKVRQLIEEDNLLQARTVSYRAPAAHARSSSVSPCSPTTSSSCSSTRRPSERGHLMWAAACRRYDLIGEFAEEVLRERFLLLTPTLDHDDFDSFIRSKALWHEELADLKDSTLRKLRSNVFRDARRGRPAVRRRPHPPGSAVARASPTRWPPARRATSASSRRGGAARMNDVTT